MITPGGELQFIGQIIKESLEYKDRIMQVSSSSSYGLDCLHVFPYRWYTSLIGLKKTIKPITQKLKANNVSTDSMRMMQWI